MGVTTENTNKPWKTVITDKGNELMMYAVANGKRIGIVEFAVGNGNGEGYEPSPTMTELKNEVWRGKINDCRISDESPNILIVSAVCPATVGGFTIREMGIFDADNNMIAVCNCAATPKVNITDGICNEMWLEMEMALINGDSVELVIDPNIVTATKKDIKELWEEIRRRGIVTINTKDAPYEENEIRLIVNETPY